MFHIYLHYMRRLFSELSNDQIYSVVSSDLHADFKPDIRGRRETLVGGQTRILKTRKQEDQQLLQEKKRKEKKYIFDLERVTIL